MKIEDFNNIKENYQNSQKVMANKCDEIAILIRENYDKSMLLTHPLIQEEFGKYEVKNVKFNNKMDCFSVLLSSKDSSNRDDVIVYVNNKTFRHTSKYINVNIDDIDENVLYNKAITRTFEKDLDDNIAYLKDLLVECEQEIEDLTDEINDSKKAINNYLNKIENYDNIKKLYIKNK